MKKLLVTSALPYANGPIHLGHLVEYIQTDVFVRFWRMRGRDVRYFCADDTHGTPIMMKARDLGVRPEELIRRVWDEHVRDFRGFGIEFDNYYTTHSEENRVLSAEIFTKLEAGGHVVERDIEQAYCGQCRTFLPDRYIRGRCPRCSAEDQYGDSCEVCSATYTPRDLRDAACAQCGSPPEWRMSRHLFFRLADFAGQLGDWLRAGHVQEEVANKLTEWFAEGLKDWDISRDAPYFGFEIPGRPGKYFYVWLDAPIGYMASTMNWCGADHAAFDAYWRREEDAEVVHFIGKDIVYFHALFWPATLMGSGFRTPTRLCVHGFLTVNGEKMSKSRGTFITAETYLKWLDPEFLRYYYAAKLSPRVEDIDLDFDDFVNRINADIVSKLANIPSRVLAIIHRDLGGRVGRCDEGGRALVGGLAARGPEVAGLYERREFGQVARALMDMAGEVNRYLQDEKPWKLASEDRSRAIAVCTGALNAFKVIATMASPIMPRFAAGFARMIDEPGLGWDEMAKPVEERAVRPYERLAERVDRKAIEAMLQASRESFGPREAVDAPVLSLDGLVSSDFEPMRVLSAEDVPGSNKLAVLRLDDGEGGRTVVAGIGHAAAAAAVGTTTLVLANLEPKALKGIESNGMILAADVGGRYLPVKIETG